MTSRILRNTTKIFSYCLHDYKINEVAVIGITYVDNFKNLIPGSIIFGAVGRGYTCLINFANAVLVRPFFSEISDHMSNCDFGAFSIDSN